MHMPLVIECLLLIMFSKMSNVFDENGCEVATFDRDVSNNSGRVMTVRHLPETWKVLFAEKLQNIYLISTKTYFKIYFSITRTNISRKDPSGAVANCTRGIAAAEAGAASDCALGLAGGAVLDARLEAGPAEDLSSRGQQLRCPCGSLAELWLRGEEG